MLIVERRIWNFKKIKNVRIEVNRKPPSIHKSVALQLVIFKVCLLAFLKVFKGECLWLQKYQTNYLIRIFIFFDLFENVSVKKLPGIYIYSILF